MRGIGIQLENDITSQEQMMCESRTQNRGVFRYLNRGVQVIFSYQFSIKQCPNPSIQLEFLAKAMGATRHYSELIGAIAHIDPP